MVSGTFVAFAVKYGFNLALSHEQNHYPDMPFLSVECHKFAVDLKSTYRLDANNVNSMTLGAFTGYFRNRESRKNAIYPYGEYAGHFVLGVIYSRADLTTDIARAVELR
jgi:hypothetical protein